MPQRDTGPGGMDMRAISSSYLLFRLGSLQYDAPHNCFELGLGREGHSPSPKTSLVDKNHLKPMVAIFPNECATSLPDVRHRWLVDLIGLTEGYGHASPVGEPARLALFAEACVRLRNPAEVVTKTLVRGRLGNGVGIP